MDDCTGFLWSRFLQHKSDTADEVIKIIKQLKTTSIAVKYIRCDNAGENQTLKNQCNKEGLGITFEYTACSTPQHNGQIERMFQTLYGRIKSMVNEAGLPGYLRTGVWAEAANMGVLWENAIVHDKGQLPAFTQFYGTDPKYVNNLHPFGKMGISVDPKFKQI